MAEEEKEATMAEATEDESNQDNSVAALKETAMAKLLNGGATNDSSTNDSISNGHDDPNGNGKNINEEIEDDDEVETIEGDDDEPMEADDDSDDIIEEERSPNGEAEEVEEEEEEDDDDDDDIQEVKDDSSSDSDVMEVEAEDPLKEVKVSSSVTSTEVKKPQVVTIDDPKQLQALASSAAKSKAERDKVTVIDTSAILAGRSTSGVTITPASSSKSSSISASPASSKDSSALPPSLASSLAASGVTISSKSTPPSSSRASPAPTAPAPVSSAPSSAFTYDSKGQLKDPNLTDDTIVIEAPSFIVPYVYEKPPKETFEAFKSEIKKLMDELRKEAAKQESEVPEKKEKKKKKKRKRKKSVGSGEEDNGEREDDDDYDAENDEDNDETDSDDSEIVEVGKRAASPDLPEVKKPVENYFESTLGKLVSNLGMTLVQETVQVDLLRQQQKKAKKDKSAAVMHAIMSLKQNIEQSKENNEAFHFDEKKCRFCSFRTESQLALEHHLETPHMKHGLYRCNFCHYETKSAQEVLGHMSGFHSVKARLERAPALHQCPQCPFEDMMKGKLTRHKVGCDKRFRPEKNQEKPLDWEPPAKIPKPPQPPTRPGVSLLNAQGMHGRNLNQNFAGVRGAFQQLNQKNIRPAMYSGMPALQFGPRGAGRPPLARPFIPNRQMQAAGIRNNAARLAGNPSVTIQSISKTGGFKSNNPSISITPVSGGAGRGAAGMKPGGLKPGAPKTGKDSVQICEICDGYIRDLEQLRNHMQFIHKVKIHPKMIHNRPPLNCQKCQYRFFTDQGLERHLLGSHGLVTASMQDLANKGQDSGRCPVCGKMFHWKLLNHVAKDHSKTLKPAHLSYKCTVCTATFGQYKLFENHVYSAHSGGRKMPQNKPMGAANRQPQKAIPGRPFKVSDEITIIPQGKNTQANKPKPVVPIPVPKKKPPTDDADIIELDDEEEEIDDVEEDGGEKKRNGNNQSPRKKNDESAKTSSANSAAEESGEEGVEEIRDDDEAEEEDDD